MNRHATCCFLTELNKFVKFEVSAFTCCFLAQEREKDMNRDSFPHPTSDVRLAVSSQKVDGAREKYLAWMLPHPLYHKKLARIF